MQSLGGYFPHSSKLGARLIWSFPTTGSLASHLNVCLNQRPVDLDEDHKS